MTAIVLISPFHPRTEYDPRRCLILTQSLGLSHVEGWRRDGFLKAAHTEDFGVPAELSTRIAAWSAQYRAVADGLRYTHTPEHCREHDVERHNWAGHFLARDIANQLPDGWVIALNRRDFACQKWDF